MKGCRPAYYDRFHCIAGACKDSCCIGWEIDVDHEKTEYYRSVSGELGERLRTCIDWKEGHFILQGKEERCPFLNKDNLCDLILGLGEDSLCDICREHPRFYDWYDDYTEVGLGLCCEEAARLLLENDAKLEFIQDPFEDQEPWINTLYSARDVAFRILQDRDRTISERFLIFASFIEELQDCIEFDSVDEAEETIAYYLENQGVEIVRSEDMNVSKVQQLRNVFVIIIKLCDELEPIDESWPEMIACLKGFIDDEKGFARTLKLMEDKYSDLDYHYEHLAVYFTYRYFMKARDDSNIRSKGMLVIFGVMLIRLLDLFGVSQKGIVTTESRVWNAKICSKEIEYSEDNLEKLDQMFWELDFEQFLG